MTSLEGWYPDPTGRYTHRRWDGQQWTSRVYVNGEVVDDAVSVALRPGQRLYCRTCHAPTRGAGWTSRCQRCTLPLTSAYIASKAHHEFKGGALVKAAQVSFDDVLDRADRAIAAGDEANALRRLDTAIAYGTVLRAVVSSSKLTRAEPLTLAALLELHLQALRLHAKFAGWFEPETFQLVLLQRLAAMYAPEGRDDLPDSIEELDAFCAARVEWIETEYDEVNRIACEYSSAFGWTTLRVALARLGYEFEERRRIGNGPFSPGELGRIEAAALLGVDISDDRAVATTIKKAYYREAAKHHPDRLAEAPEHLRLAAEERMKEINAAYELLTA